MSTYDFRATNSRGVILHTFGDLQTARKWARANASLHDGLRIEAVTVTTNVQTVYRPVAHLRDVAA